MNVTNASFSVKVSNANNMASDNLTPSYMLTDRMPH